MQSFPCLWIWRAFDAFLFYFHLSCKEKLNVQINLGLKLLGMGRGGEGGYKEEYLFF